MKKLYKVNMIYLLKGLFVGIIALLIIPFMVFDAKALTPTEYDSLNYTYNRTLVESKYQYNLTYDITNFEYLTFIFDSSVNLGIWYNINHIQIYLNIAGQTKYTLKYQTDTDVDITMTLNKEFMSIKDYVQLKVIFYQDDNDDNGTIDFTQYLYANLSYGVYATTIDQQDYNDMYQQAYNEGYNKGYDDGYIKGDENEENIIDNNLDGYDDDSYNAGYDLGEDAGYNSGYTVGYDEGEDVGYADGRNSVEVENQMGSTITGLIGNVFGTGLSFILFVFTEFELFGINVLTIFLLMISLTAAIFIIKQFL